jgi:hypothetical protein
MPFLPDAVGSVIAQRGVALELLAVDDCSVDGSREWLEACALALQQRRAQQEAPAAAGDEAAPLPLGASAYDTVVEDALAGRLPWQADTCIAATPEEVAARASPGVTLRVLCVRSAHGLSGQGLALNTALAHARAPLVGEMEADDLRPPHAFAALRDALAANPSWHGATSRIALGGWERPGMARWAAWQNACGDLGPHQLAACRFVEIPALRAAGLYRRTALARLPYRDMWQLPCGTLVDAAALPHAGADVALQAAAAPQLPLPGWWPVDSDFFGRWFAAGLTLGKLPDALYVWRQYPTQSTRTHARCSLERLRACKVHFLACAGGPAARAAVAGGEARVQLWGSGASLDAWHADLRAAGVRVQLLRWRPGEPVPPEGAWPGADAACVVARLWAFGMEKARRRVRGSASGGFDEGGRDWFIGS